MAKKARTTKSKSTTSRKKTIKRAKTTTKKARSVRKSSPKTKEIIGQKPETKYRWEAAPLKGSFMVIAILGFIASLQIVYPVSKGFGFASMLVFAMMFIASLISMTKAPVIKE